MIWVIFPLN
uniref:Uncharacterized protein n=1 Tax=Arundo donax TaxID=35708 RepID=A0A0A9AC96_ARUDO